VASGVPLPAAVAAASRNPLALLGITDRGRLAEGQRADLVELDADLRVRRVMRAGVWFEGEVG
jgi:N-acetylglucosamine-6-phosphate deacetylase